MALTLQQLTGAAERLRARRIDFGVDWLALVEQARAVSARQPFRARPLAAFRKRTGNGRSRLIARADPPERLIEEALRPELENAVESTASDAAHGYRPGRSNYTAALAASRALADGHHELFAGDIRDFFNEIDWSLLDQCLEQTLSRDTAAMVSALSRAPLPVNGRVWPRKHGIPLGRVIAPYLANLYLAPVDDRMAQVGTHYLRYADDLLLMASTASEREHARDQLPAALHQVRLRLNPDKSRRQRFDGRPVPYLGLAFDDRGVFDRMSGDRLTRIATGQARPHQDTQPTAQVDPPRAHTVYLTEQGVYLRIRSGMLSVRRGQECLREIALHRVDRILVLNSAAMSSGFFAACIQRRIPVLFFVGRGKAFGSLVAGGMPNPWRLRAQYELLSAETSRLELARAIVAAKVSAMHRRALRTRHTSSQRRILEQSRAAIDHAPDIAGLRGHEGAASRAWYTVLAADIRQPGFALERRSKRPPRDPVNSLLSFTYSLIFGEMQTALLAHGLDPHPGLLHESRPGHPALASDLIEPYRVLVADAFVRGLINRGRVQAEDFYTQAKGGVYLKDDPRRRMLKAFEDYMRSLGPGNAGLSPRHAMAGAAANMLRVVLGETRELHLPAPFRPSQDP